MGAVQRSPGPGLPTAVRALFGIVGAVREQPYVELEALYRERVLDDDDDRPGYAAAWDQFTERVLAHGGRLVVPPLAPETRLDLFATRLRTWPGRGVELREGEPSRCHGNSATLWLREQVATLVTGYALTEDDGLWRQHTWALAESGKIVETTQIRDVYAGIILDDVEAVMFAAANAPAEEFTDALLADGRVAGLARHLLAEQRSLRASARTAEAVDGPGVPA